MKRKNKKENNKSNNDVLRNKIIQLNEAILIKKIDLNLSDFISPLLWTGIPLIVAIISTYKVNKHSLSALQLYIAYGLIILSFVVLIGYVFIGFIRTLVTFKKSYKPFSQYIVDNFITQSNIQTNVNKLIKDIDKDSLKKYIAFLTNKIVQKEKRNPFIYGGIEATSFFTLVMFLINTSKNIYELLVNNKPLDIVQFFLLIVPLLFSVSFYLDHKEIEKCETVLSYLSKAQSKEE